MTKFAHFEHDLFLLMLNLTQIRDEKKIISIFTEAINSVSNDFRIRYSQNNDNSCTGTLQIKTAHHSFGCFIMSGNLAARSDNTTTLIRNSIKMLAVILENRLQERLLAKDKDRLEVLVEKQTRKIRIEKEFTETALNAQQDTFFLFEPATGRALRWNRAFNDITGYSDGEIAGKKALSSYHSHEDRKHIEVFIKSVMKKGAGMIELDLLCKDGRKIPIEYNMSVVKDDQGNPEYLIAIGRDITEHKKSQKENARLVRQLNQSQKMEAIGTLASGIAHDFNNILSPILGFAEMLLEDLPKKSQQQEYVDQILQAALRATDLVQQILTFSRQTEQENRPVKLQIILKEALKLLNASIPKTIKIKKEIDPDCGLVNADPTRLHQIIMNLATNSYHAMQQSGGILKVTLKQVKIESRLLEPFELIPGTYALLKVIDTGVGIERKILGNIFDPYFTTRQNNKGTGLGLSVVQGIVKAGKGAIHVYSEPGKGTEFHVYLPIMEKSGYNGRKTASRIIPPGGNERIMLVDDEKAIISMEHEMLRRMGYQVTSFTSSMQAFDKFKANPDNFDLIITDMNMPDMTGIQLITQIRMIKEKIPVIICTGFSDQINEDISKNMGINGFVLKPVIKHAFAKTIRDVLDM